MSFTSIRGTGTEISMDVATTVTIASIGLIEGLHMVVEMPPVAQ